MDLHALKSELTAGHPDKGPYNPDDQLATDQLNAVNRNRSRTGIPVREVINAIVASEYAAITSLERDRLQLLVSAGEIDADDPNTRAGLAAIFAAGTTSRTNLRALATEVVSRPVELGLIGAGKKIRVGEVTMARAL